MSLLRSEGIAEKSPDKFKIDFSVWDVDLLFGVIRPENPGSRRIFSRNLFESRRSFAFEVFGALIPACYSTSDSSFPEMKQNLQPLFAETRARRAFRFWHKH